ncbi:MAG: circadian clock protein KaiB [Alphaproteobacteria bacterium]|nr:circadian clock protein KaiB [Alphaproteobacteria bacterium]
MSDPAGFGRTRLRLFVTGGTTRAHRALVTVRRVCEQAFGDAYDLTVVDVLDRPDLAERDRVTATPTLVRDYPPPARRVIGDPGDGDAVRRALDLDPAIARSP